MQRWFLVVLLAVSLAACSSSQEKQDSAAVEDRSGSAAEQEGTQTYGTGDSSRGSFSELEDPNSPLSIRVISTMTAATSDLNSAAWLKPMPLSSLPILTSRFHWKAMPMNVVPASTISHWVNGVHSRSSARCRCWALPPTRCARPVTVKNGRSRRAMTNIPGRKTGAWKSFTNS